MWSRHPRVHPVGLSRNSAMLVVSVGGHASHQTGKLHADKTWPQSSDGVLTRPLTLLSKMKGSSDARISAVQKLMREVDTQQF